VTVVCLATLYVVWGSTYLAMRVAIGSFPPLAMASGRFIAAGGLLYLLLRARGVAPPTPREWGSCAAIGVLVMGVGLGGAAMAMAHVSSGLAALVFGSVPVWTALFERMFGARLRAREAAGMVLAFAGITLVATRGQLRAEPLAAVQLCTAAATYAFGCVLQRRLPQPRGGMSTAAQMLVGGLALGVASLVRGERLPTHASLASIVALAHLVVFGSMVAYSALNHLLRTARASLATSYAFVNPIVALGLGALVAGEHVGRTELVAVGLVVAGVAVVASASFRGLSTRPALGKLKLSASQP
jgi:drug/metabolite transporter (DMT)-like permease